MLHKELMATWINRSRVFRGLLKHPPRSTPQSSFFNLMYTSLPITPISVFAIVTFYLWLQRHLGLSNFQHICVSKRVKPLATSGLELLQVPSSITFLDDDAGTPEISDEEVPETDVSDESKSDTISHPAKARRRSTSESMASASALTSVLLIYVLIFSHTSLCEILVFRCALPPASPASCLTPPHKACSHTA